MESGSKSTEIFRSASVPKAVLTNIIPSVISMIMVLLYNLADTFFIGQTKDAFMVEAVSLGTPAFTIFMAVGFLFGIGGTSLISRKLGAGEIAKARNASAFCFWSVASAGILCMAAVLIWIDPVCRIVGATPETYVYVKQYVSILALGIPFLVVSNSFSNIIRSEGNAKKAMFGVILGNLTNIILDPIMILVFGWDVIGAAIATVLGNMVAAGFYICHFVLKKSALSIHPQDYRAGGGIAKGVFEIGIPASLNSILFNTATIVVNNFMTKYGDMAMAGLGVAAKVNMVAVMLLIGVGTGIQPVLGYCYGAGNRERYFAVLKFSLLLAVALSAVMTAVCYLGAGPMVSAFLTEPSAYAYGMQFARILIYSGPVIGVLFVMMNAIQAMGAAVPAMILSVSRQGLIYIPMVFLFSRVFDSPLLLAAAQPVTDCLAALLAVILYFVACRKYFVCREPAPEPPCAVEAQAAP